MYTGIILAGGKSSRMGTDKTLMYLKDERLIDRQVKELGKAVDEIIVVSNQLDKYHIAGIQEVSDIYTGMGPIGGIHAGLKAAHNYYCFVLACDMPFFQADFARTLLTDCNGFDIAVARINEYLEPLCAAYSKRCIEVLEECMQNNLRDVHNFIRSYPQVLVNYMEEETIIQHWDSKRLFLNVNTRLDCGQLITMQSNNVSKNCSI